MDYDKNTVERITKLVMETLEELGGAPEQVPVGVSARHLHLERQHVEILFGENYQLTQMKPLSQPGQFACQETVDLVGPKGVLPNVRILGPERPQTQVELATSDARKLGINPPVRTSGDLKGTPGIILCGPKGEISIAEGVIIADRHIHMTPKDARRFGVKNAQKVKLLVDGEKGGTFHNVVIRVSDQYALDCHMDTDDASAFMIKQGQLMTLIKDE